MGTALIGVIVLVGIFMGATTAIEDQLPGKYTKQEIQENLHEWVQKFKTINLEGFKNDTSKVALIVDETIAKAMNTAFDGLAIMFFLGLFASLFLWRNP